MKIENTETYHLLHTLSDEEVVEMLEYDPVYLFKFCFWMTLDYGQNLTKIKSNKNLIN